ncbi:MAG: hypothetical protein FD148_535 [Methylocystaceae bacterium]|nr:MAG: hypothetical protein FD148_535 [Methylocystaceae bacterium]
MEEFTLILSDERGRRTLTSRHQANRARALFELAGFKSERWPE